MRILMMLFTIHLCLGLHTSIMAKDIIVKPNSGTIQSAIDKAQKGDVIYIETGLYFESLNIQKAGLTIKPASDATVEITSAYPEYYHNTILWTKESNHVHPLSGRPYTIYSAPYPKAHQPKKTNQLPPYGYVADSNDQLYFTYRDQLSFSYQYAASKHVRGVYFDFDKIYLATETNPNQESLYVSNRRVVELYNASDITWDGGSRKAITIKNGGRYGMIINQLGGSQTNIKNLRFINCHSGISVNQIKSGELNIEDNLCIQHLEELPWNYQKIGITQEAGIRSKDFNKIKANQSKSVTHMETSAIIASSNKNGQINIQRNKVYGYFNGIVSTTNDVEISHNTLSDIRDDAIEIEGKTPNNIIHHNHVNCSFVGISLTPIREGPVYIYENTITMNYSEVVWNKHYKTGAVSHKKVKTLKFTGLTETDVTSDVHLYHNTFFSLDDVLNIGSKSNPRFNPQNTSFYNNLFISKNRISTSYGRPSDGIVYDGNVFISQNKKSNAVGIPTARQWKNASMKDQASLKKSSHTIVTLPKHFPGSKQLNSLKEVGARHIE